MILLAGAEGPPIGGSQSANNRLSVDLSHLHRSQDDGCSGEYLAVSGPALQEMLSGAGQLAPRLAARAREADELRGLPDESVSEIDRLGMLGAATPIALGGREEGPEAIFEVPFALAKRFAPTAWCGGNGAIHNLQSSAFRGEAQEKHVGKGVCHECRPDPARSEPRRLGPTRAHSPARGTVPVAPIMPNGSPWLPWVNRAHLLPRCSITGRAFNDQGRVVLGMDAKTQMI